MAIKHPDAPLACPYAPSAAIHSHLTNSKMKSCNAFIRLLSLSVLLGGVCSMDDPSRAMLARHVWTRSPVTLDVGDTRKGDDRVATRAFGQRSDRDPIDYNIYVNNPFEKDMKVEVKLNGMRINVKDPERAEIKTIRANRLDPIIVATTDHIPKCVTVKYVLPKAEADIFRPHLAPRRPLATSP
ncbi:hypothetical protein PtA15_15A382 [Puccinia triticina]|uniref:DUF1573 domain-containing protein n=1 Tax=Puccinia triticina TaxID=208348 RepID=A0ABY7D5B8_9BASI|nr:uncharacterized protein PtA15_15A382 [Puccinia triticina]WAQ91989.1 hypothetical protein PtA15_15A382 [Puccinia triticina]